MDLTYTLAKPSFNGILQRHVRGIALSVAIRTFCDNRLGSSSNRFHLGLLDILEEDFNEQNEFITISAGAGVSWTGLVGVIQERCSWMRMRRGRRHGHDEKLLLIDAVVCHRCRWERRLWAMLTLQREKRSIRVWRACGLNENIASSPTSSQY